MPIDPAAITQESIPFVLGSILVKVEDLEKGQQEIKTTLDEHSECLEVFRFSRCKLIPWVGRNRWALAGMALVISVWFSSLDWLNRWLQWAFFPPRAGGP